MPGLTPRKHSAGSSAIVTTCRMPTGDPRQAKVVTRWYPRGDEIYFDESGQYQFVVSGSNCTASVRRTRRLTRISKPKEKKPESKQAPTVAAKTGDIEPRKKTSPPNVDPKTASVLPQVPISEPPPLPSRAAQCKKPSRAVRLEVTPKTKLMRAGETFRYQSIARDKNGCRVSVETTWTVKDGGGIIKKNGELTVPQDAKTGVVHVEARVEKQSVAVTAKVVSDHEYEKLMAGGAYGVMGESLDIAGIELSGGHVELGTTGAATGDPDRKLLLGIAAALILFLATAAIFSVKSRKKRLPASNKLRADATLQEDPRERAPTNEPNHPDSNLAVQEDTPPPQVRLCPSCGKRYEDGTMFCVNDGARLIRSN